MAERQGRGRADLARRLHQTGVQGLAGRGESGHVVARSCLPAGDDRRVRCRRVAAVLEGPTRQWRVRRRRMGSGVLRRLLRLDRQGSPAVRGQLRHEPAGGGDLRRSATRHGTDGCGRLVVLPSGRVRRHPARHEVTTRGRATDRLPRLEAVPGGAPSDTVRVPRSNGRDGPAGVPGLRGAAGCSVVGLAGRHRGELQGVDRHMDRHRRALRTNNRLPRWFVVALVAPVVAFTAGFYLWPVIALAVESLTSDAFREVADDRALRHVLWFTAWQAAVSTVLTVVIGLVPAWVLARFEFRGRRWFTVLITVPFVLPTVVVGAAFLALLPRSLDHSVTAIVIAHVFFNIAVVVRGVGGLWAQIPRDLAAAARTLGASPRRVLREIPLPLLSPVIYASASVVLLFTFTSFGVVRLLGGPANATLEVEIWQRATRFGEVGVAAILSIAQLIILGLAVLWFAHIQAEQRLALGLRPLNQRQRPNTTRERVCVVSTCAAIVVVICTPML